MLTTRTGLGDSLSAVEDSLLFRDTHKALDYCHKVLSLVTMDASNLNDMIHDLAGETNGYAVRANLHKLLRVYRCGLEL
jgi:hypothetical protein